MERRSTDLSLETNRVEVDMGRAVLASGNAR